MILFENPLAFLFILALPIFAIFRRLGIFSRVAFPLTISDWLGKSFVYKNPLSRTASLFSALLAVIAFISLVIALANPIIREQEKIYTSRGTDILFVLDTSPSMASRDISLVSGVSTRLDAAKIGIRTLVASQKGASFGLVAMASETAIIVPPTNDHELFLNRLGSLSVGELGESSAIGTGLCTAIYHLASSTAPKKCVILITDGENNAGSVHPETAALLARENEITLYALGIGTRGTVSIEYLDQKTNRIISGSYESDFDSAPLEKIAQLAGGEYFGIESTSALADALSRIASQQDSSQTFYYRSSDRQCYRFFLLVSAILFSAAWVFKRLLLSEIL